MSKFGNENLETSNYEIDWNETVKGRNGMEYRRFHSGLTEGNLPKWADSLPGSEMVRDGKERPEAEYEGFAKEVDAFLEKANEGESYHLTCIWYWYGDKKKEVEFPNKSREVRLENGKIVATDAESLDEITKSLESLGLNVQIKGERPLDKAGWEELLQNEEEQWDPATMRKSEIIFPDEFESDGQRITASLKAIEKNGALGALIGYRELTEEEKEKITNKSKEDKEGEFLKLIRGSGVFNQPEWA